VRPVKLVCLECGTDVYVDADREMPEDVSCLADFGCACAEDDDDELEGEL